MSQKHEHKTATPKIRTPGEPGKAHSPLPWRIDGSVMHRRGADCPLIAHGDPHTEHSPLLAEVYADGGNLPAKANAKLIVASVNHADKLAEALREIFKQCAMVHKHWGDGCNSSEADAAVTQATEALAAYDQTKAGAQ